MQPSFQADRFQTSGLFPREASVFTRTRSKMGGLPQETSGGLHPKQSIFNTSFLGGQAGGGQESLGMFLQAPEFKQQRSSMRIRNQQQTLPQSNSGGAANNRMPSFAANRSLFELPNLIGNGAQAGRDGPPRMIG